MEMVFEEVFSRRQIEARRVADGAADAPVPHTLAGSFQIFDPPFRKRLVTLRTVAIFSHRS